MIFVLMTALLLAALAGGLPVARPWRAHRNAHAHPQRYPRADCPRRQQRTRPTATPTSHRNTLRLPPRQRRVIRRHLPPRQHFLASSMPDNASMCAADRARHSRPSPPCRRAKARQSSDKTRQLAGIKIQLDEEETGWVSAALLLVETPTPPITPVPTADYSLLLDIPIVDLPAVHATATAIAEATIETPAPSPTATSPRAPATLRQPPPPATMSMSSPFVMIAPLACRLQRWFDQRLDHSESFGAGLRAAKPWSGSTSTTPSTSCASMAQLSPTWTAIALTPRQDGSQYVVYWYVPFGPLTAGTFEITYRVTWQRAISDGFARYGPGTDTESEEESCSFVVR